MKRPPFFARVCISAALALLALLPSCRTPPNPLLGDWYVFRAKYGDGQPMDIPPEVKTKVSYLAMYFTAENDSEKYGYVYERKGNELRLKTRYCGTEIAETITLIDGETLMNPSEKFGLRVLRGGALLASDRAGNL